MDSKKKTVKKEDKKLFVLAENKEEFLEFIKKNEKFTDVMFLHKTKQLKSAKGSDVILYGCWFKSEIFTKEGPEMVEYGHDHDLNYRKVLERLIDKYNIVIVTQKGTKDEQGILRS
ncbi:MAG: hypothetical protein KAS32_17530 [Candidatus Peribacteraceae bacterium]|nr:hypothetical protein [Candidatus Peribacteraceae bacterium]